MSCSSKAVRGASDSISYASPFRTEVSADRFLTALAKSGRVFMV